MIYLSIDPGGTTGFAWLVEAEPGQFMFGGAQVSGRYEAERFVREAVLGWPMGLVGMGQGCTVIIERWDVRANTHQLTNQDDPRYIIGWVDGFCHHEDIPYHEQKPAQAKKFATDPALKRVGWYLPGQDHARDAARHLLTFLAKSKSPAGAHVREMMTR